MTVNFRLFVKVIIRQNETQYFTYSIYTEQESKNSASLNVKDYVKLLNYINMLEILLYLQIYIFLNCLLIT